MSFRLDRNINLTETGSLDKGCSTVLEQININVFTGEKL